MAAVAFAFPYARDRSSFSYFSFFPLSLQGPSCNFASSGLTRFNCDWAQSKGCPASESVPAFGPAISFSFPRFAPGPNNFGQKPSGKRKLFGQA
ncbi:Pyruvate decarboxylase [Fusarium oxysporum f. sp. albedinis]|nr:Pyruvate decarboxylase [Fusarium oxysporum f. sp. albedinis]